MNASGIVIIVAGVWVATQILGGDALKRLKLVGGGQDPVYNVDPDTGVPNQNPNLPPLTDGKGRIF